MDATALLFVSVVVCVPVCACVCACARVSEKKGGNWFLGPTPRSYQGREREEVYATIITELPVAVNTTELGFAQRERRFML